jgi:ABC-2 type transport system ATP-binding protein
VAPALDLRGVRKQFAATTALRGVDLRLEPGELVGLLGPNGAGKSTLIKIACGLVRPTAGSVEVCGAPGGSPAARRQLGYLAEVFRFPEWLTPDEILRLHQRLAGSRGGADERRRLLELAELTAQRDRRVGELSKGMQQRLGIAQALVGEPRLVLLDEPTSALDPVGRRAVRELLADLRGRGVAVLVNSHLLTEVEQTCERIVILDAGRVVRAATMRELLRPRGVKVTTARGVVDHPGVCAEDIPGIVRALVERGDDVYGVAEDAPTIEDLYLEVLLAARDPAAGFGTHGRQGA